VSNALMWLKGRTSSRAPVALLRAPISDRFCPTSVDLDVVLFGDVESFYPERVYAPDGTPIDLVWYPERLLSAPESLASLGLGAHRCFGSILSWDLSGRAEAQWQAFRSTFYEPNVQARRIDVFMQMGYLTVREIGVTFDFPALAMFWLQMGHAGCIAALADATGILCPNVFTRPFGYAQELDRETGGELERNLVRTLKLGADPRASIEPLRRIHRAVTARFSRPTWPEAMRVVTREEYAYTASARELEWRIAVASEMEERGFPEAALYYLRFWAYSLARLPMVWHCAAEGRDVAFLRPERAVRPQLERICPEILSDLTAVLGGDTSTLDVELGIQDLNHLRSRVLDLLGCRQITPREQREWRPFGPPTPTHLPTESKAYASDIRSV
jgi:hypothetical protein